MKSIFSQASAFKPGSLNHFVPSQLRSLDGAWIPTSMIPIATIHWPMTHCNNPWSKISVFVGFCQVSFHKFDFSGVQFTLVVQSWVVWPLMNPWLDLGDVVCPRICQHHNNRIQWCRTENELDPYQNFMSSKFRKYGPYHMVHMVKYRTIFK